MNEKYNVVGIIDDSKAKLHCLINGVEVLGNRKAVVARELTKLHEEFIRGNLMELSKLKEIKGEIVLLIEGKKENKEIDYDSLKDEVLKLVDKGLKKKDAINEVADKYKVSKNKLKEIIY